MPGIAIAISILLCLALLGAVAGGIYAALAAKPSDGRVSVQSILEHVPYRKLLADGIVELEDGKLLTAWEITGGSSSRMTYDRYAKFAFRMNELYAKRDGAEATMINFDDFREAISGYPEAPGDHRDPTTTVMHESREHLFGKFVDWLAKRKETRKKKLLRQFDSQKFFTLTWTPPSALEGAVSKLVTVSTAKRANDAWATFRQAIADFEEQCEEFVDNIPNELTARRLTTYTLPDVIDEETGEPKIFDELLEFLHRCVTGEVLRIKRPPIALVQGLLSTPLEVAHIVCDQDIHHGFVTRVGGLYHQVIQVESFKKGGTTPGAFDVLSNLKIPLRISLRAMTIDPEVARRMIDSRFKKHMGNTTSPLGRLFGATIRHDNTAQKKANAAEDADTSGENSLWVHWNLKVVLVASSEAMLEKAAGKVKKILNDEDFGARIEDVGNSSALVASWPGESASDRSSSMIDTLTLADLTSVCEIYGGPKEHPNTSLPPETPPVIRGVTTGNKPIDIYACVEDLSHLGILGETGGGKSVTSTGLCYAERAMYDNIDHFLFDQGRSAERYVRAAGGAFSLADPADEEGGLNPFYRCEVEAERLRLELWLTPMFEMQRQPVSPVRQEYIQKALRLLSMGSKRSMSLFQAKLGTMDPDFAKALTFWTIRGPMGYLLDSETDHFVLSSLQCFELEKLMRFQDGNGKPDNRATAPYITLLFNRIRDNADKQGRRIRVRLDEPQDYFQNEVFAMQIATGYDRGRKSDWGMGISTQRPQQFLNSPVAGAIIDATKSWIFTPSEHANGEFKPFYHDRLGVPNEGCKMIAEAEKKKQIVTWQDGKLALVNLRWTDEELLMIAASSKDEKAETSDLRSRYPSHWPAELYARHNMHDAAVRWVERAKELGLVEQSFEMPSREVAA